MRTSFARRSGCGVVLAVVLGACAPTRPLLQTVDRPLADEALVAPSTPAGPRSVRVVFEGNVAVSNAELQAVMRPFADASDEPTIDEDVLARDVMMLSALYFDKGYVMIHIDDPAIALASDGPYLDVHLRIKEGPRFHLGVLHVQETDSTGREVPSIEPPLQLRGRIATKDGEWFSRAVMAEGIESIRTRYRDAGYALVEADPETTVDVEHAVIDLSVPIHRGPLTYVSHVSIEGAVRVPMALVKSKVLVKDGALFSETDLVGTKHGLEALGLFERVDISTENDDPTSVTAPSPAHIVVHVELREANDVMQVSMR
jgi:outer membrane protein insertion porin family